MRLNNNTCLQYGRGFEKGKVTSIADDVSSLTARKSQAIQSNLKYQNKSATNRSATTPLGHKTSFSAGEHCHIFATLHTCSFFCKKLTQIRLWKYLILSWYFSLIWSYWRKLKELFNWIFRLRRIRKKSKKSVTKFLQFPNHTSFLFLLTFYDQFLNGFWYYI